MDPPGLQGLPSTPHVGKPSFSDAGTELGVTVMGHHLMIHDPLLCPYTTMNIYFWLGKSFLCGGHCVPSLELILGMVSSSPGLGRNRHAFLLSVGISHAEHRSPMHMLLCYSSHLHKTKESKLFTKPSAC